MSDCEKCRNYKDCISENKDKVDKCFFGYPTEDELAKDTKEYEIGYKQGIADERKRIIEELEELRDRYDKNDFGIRGILEKAIEIVKVK